MIHFFAGIGMLFSFVSVVVVALIIFHKYKWEREEEGADEEGWTTLSDVLFEKSKKINDLETKKTIGKTIGECIVTEDHKKLDMVHTRLDQLLEKQKVGL